MHKRLLEFLVCPDDKNYLDLRDPEYEADEIKTAILRCSSCKKDYPVIEFIPKFVNLEDYSEVFGFQWKIFRQVQIDSVKSQKSKNTFIKKTSFSEEFLRGKLVLDAGVGAGRFADIVSSWGGEVVGIDMSSAVTAAYLNLKDRKNIHIIQADLFGLPFKEDTFDIIYSIGVLHHTPDAEAAFKSISKYLKKGGTIAIWLYEQYRQSRLKSLKASDKIRRYTTRMSPKTLYYLCSLSIIMHYIYKIPFFRPLRRYLPISKDKNWKWRWLDTFDYYHPKYQSRHTYPEVYRWFNNNFSKIELLDEPLSIRAIK